MTENHFTTVIKNGNKRNVLFPHDFYFQNVDEINVILNMLTIFLWYFPNNISKHIYSYIRLGCNYQISIPIRNLQNKSHCENNVKHF